MSWLKHMYLMATIVVSSIFIGLFVYGLIISSKTAWIALLPVALCWWDFIRTVRRRRDRRPTARVVPDMPWPRPDPPPAPNVTHHTEMSSDSTLTGTTGPAKFIFISKEEFSV